MADKINNSYDFIKACNDFYNDCKGIKRSFYKDKVKSDDQTWSNYFNTRNYEERVRDEISNLIDPINSTLFNDYNNDIKDVIREMDSEADDKTKNEKKELAFIMLFALFTCIRKNEFFFHLDGEKLSIETFAKQKEFYKTFKEYKFYDYICYLGEYYVETNKTSYLNTILDIEHNLVNDDKKTYAYHPGVICFYSEIVSEYYEAYLEETAKSDDQLRINRAIKLMNNCIHSPKDIYNNEYHKFYYNLARLYILNKNYNSGYECLALSIQKAKGFDFTNKDFKQSTINEYEMYYIKASSIQTYFEHDEKIVALQKMKIDNYKTLSLISALLGFITGEVGIFKNIEDINNVLKFTILYAGLIMLLLSIVLIFINVLSKEKFKKHELIVLVIMLLVSCLICSLPFWIEFTVK